jgi:hypothetical protein
MFAAPRRVFKGGVCVAESGRVREQVQGRTLELAPEHDPAVERGLRALLAREGTLALEDYVVAGSER